MAYANDDLSIMVYDTRTVECGPNLGAAMRDTMAQVFPDYDVSTLAQLGSGTCKPEPGYSDAWWTNIGTDDDWVGRFTIHRAGYDLANRKHIITVERLVPKEDA